MICCCLLPLDKFTREVTFVAFFSRVRDSACFFCAVLCNGHCYIIVRFCVCCILMLCFCCVVVLLLYLMRFNSVLVCNLYLFISQSIDEFRTAVYYCCLYLCVLLCSLTCCFFILEFQLYSLFFYKFTICKRTNYSKY